MSRSNPYVKRVLRVLFVVFLVSFSGCGKPPAIVEFPGEAIHYTLQPGETLYDLAERTYQDRSLGWALAMANELPDPGVVEPGTSVVIPRSRDVLSSMFERRRPAKVPFNRGTYLLELGRAEEAAAQLERALSEVPQVVTPRYHLGLAYLRQGLVSDAVQELEEVVRRRPLDRDFHYGLGYAYLEQGSLSKARREFKQALRFDPEFAPAQFGLAMAAVRMGKRRDASAAWQAYLELEPEGEWAERARDHLSELYSD